MNIRDYCNPDGSPPETQYFKIWEAALCTSAAPLYFKAAEVNNEDYWDGAMTKNNPINQMWDEKLKYHRNDPVTCVISLGTGFQTREVSNRKSETNWKTFKKVFKMITNTEHEHTQFREKAKEEGIAYFRLNPEIGYEMVNLADYAKIDVLEEKTEAYLKRPDIREQINKIACLLTGQTSRPTTKPKPKDLPIRHKSTSNIPQEPQRPTLTPYSSAPNVPSSNRPSHQSSTKQGSPPTEECSSGAFGRLRPTSSAPEVPPRASRSPPTSNSRPSPPRPPPKPARMSYCRTSPQAPEKAASISPPPDMPQGTQTSESINVSVEEEPDRVLMSSLPLHDKGGLPKTGFKPKWKKISGKFKAQKNAHEEKNN